jgi:hypothetical protein
MVSRHLVSSVLKSGQNFDGELSISEFCPPKRTAMLIGKDPGRATGWGYSTSRISDPLRRFLSDRAFRCDPLAF